MRPITLILLTGVLLLGASVSTSQGATITWTGNAGDNSWHTPGNWNLNRVPGTGDDVVLPSLSDPLPVSYTTGSTSIHSLVSHMMLQLTGGTLQVTSTSDLLVLFQLTGGTFDIEGSATFESAFRWSGGTVTGAGTATLGAHGNCDITGSVHLKAPVINQGIWTGHAASSLELNATFQNYSGGAFDIVGSMNVYTGTQGTFNNQSGATFDVACPGDTATFRQPTFSNAGLIHVESGTLDLGNVTSSGTILVDQNGVCDCNSLGMSGGGAIGSGTLTLGGFTWTGGTLSGGGVTTVRAGVNWTISGANLNLWRTLQNNGNCTWGGGTVNLASSFLNQSGALFRSADGSTGQIIGAGLKYEFQNQAGATFQASSGSVTLTSMTLTNAGTLDLGNSRLTVDGDSLTSTGTITGSSYGLCLLRNASVAHIAAGSSFLAGLTCDQSSFYAAQGADFAPMRSVLLYSSLLQIDCDATIPDLAITSGTLTGAGAVTAQGLSWSGGTMSGTGTTTIPASTAWSIDGGVDCQLSRTLYNDGNCSWQAGSGGHLYIDGTFANRSGGWFRALNDQTIDFASTLGTFDNQAGATFEKSASTGTTTVNRILFNNAGTISVQSGILTVTGQFPSAHGYDLLSGTYDLQGIFRYQGARIDRNYATIILDGPGSAIQNTTGADALYNVFEENHGAFTVTNGRSLTTYTLNNYGQVFVTASGVWIANQDSRQDAGVIHLDTGTLTVGTGRGALNINSGVLSGTGTINAAVTNSATLSPGSSPGAIHITFRYLQGSTGVLVAEVGGSDPGTGYDVVTVDNQAGLGGSLQPSVINGYVPPDGAVFDILTASSISSAFANTGLPCEYPGGCLTGQQLTDRFRLTGHTLVITQQPQSQTVPVGAPAVFTVALNRNAAYQWRKDGQPIQGATNDTLVIAQALPGDAGSYDVICTSDCAEIQSAPAILTVVDLTPPQVQLTSPNGGEVWDGGSTHAITWTASDNVGVTAIDLAGSFDGGQTYPLPIASGLPNSGTFQWVVPDTACVTARVRVTAHDAAGNTASDASDGNFAIRWMDVGVESGLLGVRDDLAIHPNPSRGGDVRVIYRLAQTSQVEIDIFDPEGRLVRRLEGGPRAAGVHVLDWDRRDDHGNPVASGAYLVHLSRGDAKVVTKMLVIIR